MIDIKALKSRFIDLAIRGKLVSQLDEEPSVTQIGDVPEEPPFEIPEKWKWVFLEEMVMVCGGKRIPAGKQVTSLQTGHRYIRVSDMKNGTVDLKTVPYITDDIYESIKRYTISKDDIYITVAGTIGRVGIIPVELDGANLTENADKLVLNNDALDKQWLVFALISACCQNQILEFTTQVGQPKLAIKRIKSIAFPLPPLSEQRRIVTRLNEIFAILDKAEDCFLRVQDLGKSLKDKFLQMAIEGKLVPQLDEEPYVTQIGDAPEESPFEIPEKWKWVELSAVGNVVGGGTPSTSVLDYWDGTIPWLTPADMGKFTSKYVEKCSKFITQKGLDHSSAKLMPKGTVIYSSRAPIGYVAIAKDSICTNQGCKSLVPNTEFVISEYIYFCLINRTEDIKFRASGTTFKEISGRNFGETLIPLPPLSEQRRIVIRLNELFALVDKMTGVEGKE